MNKKGISLVALIITIIVLIILTGTAVSMLSSENGIFDTAHKAVIISNLQAVKEEIDFKIMDNSLNGKQTTIDDLLNEGFVKRVVVPSDNGNYTFAYVLVDNSLNTIRNYGKGNPSTGKDVYFIDNNFNIKYVDKNGNEYGDEVQEQILQDDTKVTFKDDSFSKYISKVIGVNEDELTFEWMKNQTSLTIDAAEIKDLNDLVFFPNLTTLTLRSPTQLTSLEGIENCAKLKEFLSYGAIKQMSTEDAKRLSKCSELTNLMLQYFGGQTDFENLIDGIKNIENLTYLSVPYANIENVKKLRELNSEKIVSLGFTGNKIQNIEGMEHFKKIRVLDLSNNNISDILQLANIASIDVIQELKLTKNSGINANREEYTQEEIVLINKIGAILDRGGKIDIDIDKLKLFNNYTRLSLIGQNIKDLTLLEGMTELTFLDVQNNTGLLLNDEESKNILLSMTKLNFLALSNCGQVNVSVLNSMPSLNGLYLVQPDNITIDLKDMEDVISQLNEFRCNQKTLETINNCNPDKITKLNIASSPIATVPDLSKFTKLTNLKIAYNSNTNADYTEIKDLTWLETLNLNNNDMNGNMIDFSNFTSLKTLNLSNNNLWSDELVNLKGLKNNKNMTINLSNNAIIDATALLELDPSTKIDLRNNVNLSQESKTALTARFGSNVSY